MISKEFKLNFKPDTPTVNGRIYPMETFIDSMKVGLEREGGLPITLTCINNMETVVNLADVLGFVRGYHFEKDGIVILTCDLTEKGIEEIDDTELLTSKGLTTFRFDKHPIVDTWCIIQFYCVSEGSVEPIVAREDDESKINFGTEGSE